MRIVLLAAAILALVSPAAAQVITPAEMLRSSVTNFIRPQMRNFAEQAGALVPTLNSLCAEPGGKSLASAQAAFAATASAYGRIEFLRIGALLEHNRAERILFWPDRRGIGLRQVQELLAEEDEAATDPAGLEGKSVAVQGLGALEFVLFGTGSERLAVEAESFRCRYGSAIAANVARMAEDLAADWADPQGIATRLTQPQSSNADFRTTTESLEALVGLISHGVEAVRDTRINPFIARGDQAAKPRQALFWRSGQTIPMLRAEVAAMRSLVTLSGIATDPVLANSIEDAFAHALSNLDVVTDNVELAVADPRQAEALAQVVVATQDLQRLIGEDLSATLGLSVGFSSLDGD